MDEYTLLHGDCLAEMAAMDAGSVDAVVTDPPYGLGFMGKAWDSFDQDAVEASWSGKGRRQECASVPTHRGTARTGVGFRKPNPRCGVCGRVMNGRDTAKGFKVCHCENPVPIPVQNRDALRFQMAMTEWAGECWRVLKPSHYLLAFGGTRTWHRLACAIEDAGFEIRDTLTLFWVYGSGFPKGKSCLKPAHEPVLVAQKPATIPQHIQTMLDIIDERTTQWQAHGCSEADTLPSKPDDVATALSTLLSWRRTLVDVCDADERTSTTSTATGPTTDWKTLSFCLSQITPADITQAPILPSGLSASASDAARYFSAELLRTSLTRELSALAPAIESARISLPDGTGRGLQPNWTPVILARKPGPMRELGIEECRIGTRDESQMYVQPRPTTDAGGASWSKGEHVHFHYGESGGRWPANLILECTCDETREGTAKSTGGGMHNADKYGGGFAPPGTANVGYGKEPVRIHTDPNCPCAMLDGQTGTKTSGSRVAGVRKGLGYHGADGDGGPAIVGDSGGASRFFYCAKASRSERNAGCEGMEERDCGAVKEADSHADTRVGRVRSDGYVQHASHPVAANHHPTVKPLALMRWLVKLVAQPGDVVVDPFMGSGTTGVACVMEGREFIGIEREAEYVEIARRRIAHASAQGRLPLDESPPLPPVAGRPT